MCKFTDKFNLKRYKWNPPSKRSDTVVRSTPAHTGDSTCSSSGQCQTPPLTTGKKRMKPDFMAKCELDRKPHLQVHLFFMRLSAQCISSAPSQFLNQSFSGSFFSVLSAFTHKGKTKDKTSKM